MTTTGPAATPARLLPDGMFLLSVVAPSPEELESGAQPSAVFAAVTDVDRDHLLEQLGDDDLLGNPATRLRGYTDRSSVRSELVVVAQGPVTERLVAAARAEQSAVSTRTGAPTTDAPASTNAETTTVTPMSHTPATPVPAAVLPGADDPTPPATEVVAYGQLDLDLLDNTSSCAMEVFVRAPHRRQGTGRALADHLTALARAEGRTIVQGWADHASPGDGLETLAPSTGAGEIGLDRNARFIRAQGLALEQVERHSVLRIAGRVEGWRDQLAEALTHTLPTDEVATWEGPTPEEELEHIAELMRRMSTDIPLGGLSWEEEVWDADRVRRSDTNRLASGHRRQLRTVVRDRTTGALVAHSVLEIPVGRPVAWQGDTLVMKEHRGRRLGTIVKLANQLELVRQFSDVERIHTWNAFENGHMLDVNHALGFELVALEGAWQGRLA